MPNWDEFENLLTEKFKPVNTIKAARNKLASLKQTESVKAYNDLFLGTILEIPTISEEEQLDQYICGLKEKVHVEVELREPSNLKEAMRIADRYDTISFAYTKRTPYIPRPQGTYTPNTPRTNTLGPVPMEIDNIQRAFKKRTEEERNKLRSLGAYFNCRHVEHMVSKCPNSTCRYYKEQGHTVSRCPKKPTQALRNIEGKEVRMKVRKITPDATIPKIQTPGAIGLDLHTNKEVIIPTK